MWLILYRLKLVPLQNLFLFQSVKNKVKSSSQENVKSYLRKKSKDQSFVIYHPSLHASACLLHYHKIN